MSENLTYYPARGYVEAGRYAEQGYRRVRFVKRLRDGSG